jgi:hypothetical protein
MTALVINESSLKEDKTLIIHLIFFQDLLMVIYLTQLTKTQLQLHEKLTAVSINQLRDYQKLLPE